MAVRDLLWGCPICRAAGAIRPDGRRERCRACEATFRRGRGATIVADRNGERQERSAADWVRLLGPVEAPLPQPDGLILGPDPVRVKLTATHRPLRFGSELLGWVESYHRAEAGTLSLGMDGLHFQRAMGDIVHWSPADLTGLQPASSSLQLGLRGRMASVKFLEGSVRLWTRAVSDLLRAWHLEQGRDVFEIQPYVRTRPLALARS